MDRISILRAFVRLVELGSFSAVAQDQGVGQSTVSKWIASLEEDLGVRLLDRTTRSMHPTQAGAHFYSKVCAMLAMYDEARGSLGEVDDVLRGRIRVSVPVVFGQLYMVDAIASFAHKHPHVELDVVFSDRYVHLVEERFDVAVRVGSPVDSSLRARKIGATRRVLVASPSYLQGRESIQTPEDLERHACLIHSGVKTRSVWVFGREGVEHRVRVRGSLRANHSGALCSFACDGHGVALLAWWLVEAYVLGGELEVVLPHYEPPEAPIYALMPPGDHVAAHVRAFVDHTVRALCDVG